MDTIQYFRDVVQAILKELLRYRVLVALCFSLVLGLVMVAAIFWPKYYVSTAVIVKDDTNVIAPLLKEAAQVVDVDKNENIRGLVLSRRLLSQVLDRISPGYEDASPEEQALLLGDLRDNIDVSTRGNTSKLSLKAETPEGAYEALTAVVNVFLADRIANKQEKGYEAHDFIASQADAYRKKLLKAEDKLKVFKSKSVDVTENDVKNRISSLSSELQELTLSIDELSQVEKTLNYQLKAEGDNIETRKKVRVMEDRREALADQLDQLRLIYQDNYPDIITIKSQISELDAALEQVKRSGWVQGSASELPLIEEIRKKLSATIVERESKKRRVDALQKLLVSERELADEISNNQAELVELTRDYNVTRRIYEDMLAKKESASITLDLNDEGQGANYKLVDAPRYPLTPDGLRALFIYLFAPIAAIGVPIGLAVAFVLFDPRIRSVAVLETKLPEGVLLLSDIPHRNTPLSSKLLRKDVFVLMFYAVVLMGVYIYVLYIYRDVL